jgi:hypothetical protein
MSSVLSVVVPSVGFGRRPRWAIRGLSVFWLRQKAGLPTAREGVAFLLTGHLGVHLGQLSAWRRMIDLAPLF